MSAASEFPVLVFGGDNGFRNLGDQAMLIEVARRYAEVSSRISLTAFTRHPDRMPTTLAGRVTFTSAMHRWFAPNRTRAMRLLPYEMRDLGVCYAQGAALLARAALLRKAPADGAPPSPDAALPEILRHARALHCYGGGYFNDFWLTGLLIPFSFTMLAAELMGIPVYVTGQGLGPVTSPAAAALLRRALGAARLVAVREGGGAESIHARLGKPGRPFLIDGDDASGLLACAAERADAILRDEGVDVRRPLLAVHCRRAEYVGVESEQERWFSEILDRLVAELGVHLVFVPLCHDAQADDALHAFAVWRRLRNRQHATLLAGRYDAHETKGIIAACQAGIGFSYHFALFGLCAGVPIVPLYLHEYYRMKFDGLLAHFGAQDLGVSLDASAVERMPALVRGLLGDSHRRDELRRRGQEMTDRVGRTFARIAADLGFRGGEAPASNAVRFGEGLASQPG